VAEGVAAATPPLTLDPKVMVIAWVALMVKRASLPITIAELAVVPAKVVVTPSVAAGTSRAAWIAILVYLRVVVFNLGMGERLVVELPPVFFLTHMANHGVELSDLFGELGGWDLAEPT